jgi:hypothetical protein
LPSARGTNCCVPRAELVSHVPRRASLGRNAAVFARNAMDALSEVLKSVRLEGALYVNAEFTAPWCIRGECSVPSVRETLNGAGHVVFFHFVTEGSCKLRLAGATEVHEGGAGDLILIAQDDRHLLGSDLDLAPFDTDTLLAGAVAGDDEIVHLRHGGGGVVTRFVCGYLACDRAVCRLLLEALPRVLRIPTGDGPASSMLRDLLRIGVRASSALRPARCSPSSPSSCSSKRCAATSKTCRPRESAGLPVCATRRWGARSRCRTVSPPGRGRWRSLRPRSSQPGGRADRPAARSQPPRGVALQGRLRRACAALSAAANTASAPA